MYFVYQIKADDKVVYIGRTNNIKRRQYEHRYNYSRMQSKALYKYLRTINYKAEDIVLECIYETNSKTEIKRMELYLILKYHFEHPKQLKNKIPAIKR